MTNVTNKVYPPVDFSFKDLKTFADMLKEEPRGGQRKKLKRVDKSSVDQQSNSKEEKRTTKKVDGFSTGINNSNNASSNNNNNNSSTHNARHQGSSSHPNPGTIPTKTADNANSGDAAGGSTDDTEQQQLGKFLGHALKVANNALDDNSWKDFKSSVEAIMDDPNGLTWLDASFNQFTEIDKVLLNYDFTVLYLHANNIKDMSEINKLQRLPNLRSLTLHGNPIENTKNYRFHVIAMLPQLRTLDFTTITRKDRDTAATYRSFYLTPSSKKKEAKPSWQSQ